MQPPSLAPLDPTLTLRSRTTSRSRIRLLASHLGEAATSETLSPLLRRLRTTLDERGWLESCTPWSANSAGIVRGRWIGRRLRLAQWAGEDSLTIRLSLRQGPEVTVSRASLLQRLDPRRSADRARVGDLWIQGHPGGVGRMLRRENQIVLRCLFNELGIDEVRLGARWARVQRRCEPNLAQAAYFTERLLDVLAALGNLSDPPLETRTTLRVSEVLRCPFCHDSLRLSVEPSASCGACGTLHHTACALEATSCTTLGCPSRVFVAQPPGAGSGLVVSPPDVSA